MPGDRNVQRSTQYVCMYTYIHTVCMYVRIPPLSLSAPAVRSHWRAALGTASGLLIHTDGDRQQSSDSDKLVQSGSCAVAKQTSRVAEAHERDASRKGTQCGSRHLHAIEHGLPGTEHSPRCLTDP